MPNSSDKISPGNTLTTTPSSDIRNGGRTPMQSRPA
jgi:hypothetical protein